MLHALLYFCENTVFVNSNRTTPYKKHFCFTLISAERFILAYVSFVSHLNVQKGCVCVCVCVCACACVCVNNSQSVLSSLEIYHCSSQNFICMLYHWKLPKPN